MIALISFILVLIGCANWLTIGILQFDFVAGLFGSQANIFSRIVYVVIGIGAVIVSINLIKNKGKLTFNLKKLNKKTMQQNPVFVPEENNMSRVRAQETSADLSNQNANNASYTNTNNESNQVAESRQTSDQNKYADYRRQFAEYAHDMSHKTADSSPVKNNKQENCNCDKCTNKDCDCDNK